MAHRWFTQVYSWWFSIGVLLFWYFMMFTTDPWWNHFLIQWIDTGWWFGTWFFFHLLGMSSSQLTKSIIFQRFFLLNHQPEKWQTLTNINQQLPTLNQHLTTNQESFPFLGVSPRNSSTAAGLPIDPSTPKSPRRPWWPQQARSGRGPGGPRLATMGISPRTYGQSRKNMEIYGYLSGNIINIIRNIPELPKY